MKANELMIGDWMRHANGKCYQVTRIDGLSDGSVHFACSTPHLWEYNNKFEPIPLTPEILEANGFKNDDNARLRYYTFADDTFSIDIAGECTIEDMVVEYVHELQHALRLCGIEKEIKIK